MTRFADSLVLWLGDFYLLSSLLLALALAAAAFLRQPAHRLAITKATLVALAILAALCALPRWSVVHLMAAKSSQPELITPTPDSPATIDPIRIAPATAPRNPAVTQEAAGELPQATMDFGHDTPPISWPMALFVIYATGTFGLTIWLCIGSLAARRLRQSAAEAPEELLALLKDLDSSSRVSPKLDPASRRDAATWSRLSETRISLLISNRIDVPVALGLFRPAILLPQSFAQAAIRKEFTRRGGKSEIASILAHELAHIHNRDLYWLAASRLLMTLLWAQPLFYLLRRRMRLEQESLADAAAAEVTSRQNYAEHLVAWARNLAHRPSMRIASAVGLWEGPSQLRQRIAILLNERFIVLRNSSRRWRMVTAAASMATAGALSMLTLQPTTRANEKSPASEPPPAIPSTVTIKTERSEPSAQFKPNTITGRVVDEKDQPIAGAEALLFRINRVDNLRKLQAKTATDADGKYRFDNVIDIPKEFSDKEFLPLNPLEEEFVQVYVRSPGRVAGMGMDLRQRIASTGEVFDMTLKPASTLTGRVTGPDGKPIAGALVMVGNFGFSAWEGVGCARTKTDGTYTIHDVAPYSMEEYRKKEDEQRQRSMNTFAKSKDSYSFYVMPPVMMIQHPDFAIRRANYDKIPGAQDVQLEPAATVEGRVQFGDSGKPAAGAIVHLATSRSSDTLPKFPESMSLQYADARADAEGKYKFAMLPAASYDLWAEMPGWVNAGIDAFPAATGETSTAPNLILTRGGVISIRLIDDKTGKPIALTPDVRADISVHPFPFPKGINRPSWNPNAAANSAGRFEIHTLPGKRAIMVSVVYVGEQPTWASKSSPGELKLPTVDVVEGKAVEVDIPVVGRSKPTITGTFVPLPLAPTENEEPQPTPKSSPGRPEKPAASDHDNEQQGSQMLRDLRAKAAPLLAKMASEHGYGLAEGQDVARVAPPFAPIRMEWYRVANPTQAEHIPRGPESMLFRWSKSKLQNWGMSFNDPDNPGSSVLDLCNWILGVKSQGVEGPENLLKKVTPGDWVVRTSAKTEVRAEQLQAILQKECSIPVRLEFREVKRPVYVASGEYGKITPPPGFKAQDVTIYTNKTVTSDEIQIYGKELVPNSGSGGGTGDFDEFLSWLGRWIEAPIVSEVKKPPKNEISWHLHGRSPFTKEMEREDHDPQPEYYPHLR